MIPMKFAGKSRLVWLLLGILANQFVIPHIVPILSPEWQTRVTGILGMLALLERIFGGDNGAHQPLAILPQNTGMMQPLAGFKKLALALALGALVLGASTAQAGWHTVDHDCEGATFGEKSASWGKSLVEDWTVIGPLVMPLIQWLVQAVSDDPGGENWAAPVVGRAANVALQVMSAPVLALNVLAMHRFCAELTFDAAADPPA